MDEGVIEESQFAANQTARTTRTVLIRLGVFLLLVNFLNATDRFNIGFAALRMNSELGLDPRTYGWAVGIFFVGYMFFQLPVAAITQRAGASRTLGVMLVGWGAASFLMGTVGSAQALLLWRFMLGVAESGVVPAIVLMQSTWIPQRSLGRILTATYMAGPLAGVITAPLSGALMTRLDGVAGFSGWRWMFFAEALPSILLGLYAWFRMPTKPADATWLSPAQRRWLADTIAADAAANRSGPTTPTDSAGTFDRTAVRSALRDSRMWLCGGVLFCLLLGLYSLFYWVPQLIQRLGHGASVMTITWLSALPWIGNAVGMLFVGWHSDKRQERYWHLAIAAACGGVGLAIAGSAEGLPVALIGLTIASLGFGGSQATFWSIPIGFLRGAGNAATVFACMNFLGNLAGVFGGIVIGWLVQTTGSFRVSIYVLAGVLAIGVVMILALERRQRSANLHR